MTFKICHFPANSDRSKLLNQKGWKGSGIK